MRQPPAAPIDPAAVAIRPLRRNDGPLVEGLFGASGACGVCWCMYWRRERHGRLWQELKGARNRDDFLALIAAGKVHAMLALHGRLPLGWCCFGPFDSFPRLLRSKPLQRERPAGTWAIVCLFLARGARRRGIGTRLVAAAAEEALRQGAALVEGYPVRPKPGQRVPDPFAYTGVPAQFEQAGFTPLPRTRLREIPRLREIHVRTPP